ncbi:helix-turn-helix domain-containing protein, partial [Nocardia brasiliensis]|uniref:helix-turn-helix domain-containing protein n=1 Tax=Nocardia brasiliensis TaxID=37326 RepID=UPI002455B8C5
MATNPRVVGALTKAVSAEIRRQRAARKWKQERVSEASGIVQATLSRLERGVVAIDLEQLDGLAHAFGMTPERLLAEGGPHAQGRPNTKHPGARRKEDPGPAARR